MSGKFGIEVVLPGFGSFSSVREAWRADPDTSMKAEFEAVVAELLSELSPYRDGVDVSSYLAAQKPVRYLVVDLSANHRGHIVGVGTLLPSLKQHRGEIHDVVVALRYRHSSLGTELVKKMIEMAKNLDLTTVEARVRESPKRAAAHRFFRRLGFQPAGIQEADGVTCYQFLTTKRRLAGLSQ